MTALTTGTTQTGTARCRDCERSSMIGGGEGGGLVWSLHGARFGAALSDHTSWCVCVCACGRVCAMRGDSS